MIAQAVVLASAVLLAARGDGEGPRFEGSVGAGGGYDSNVDLASSRANVPSFGTSTATAWADGGLSFELAPPTRLYAGLRYDGVVAFEAGDLSYSALGIEIALTHEFTDWLALIVTPTVGYSAYGDSARSGVRATGRVTLRAYAWPWLALRVGYARSQSWASDDVFSLGTDRVLAGAEARIARRSYLGLGYSLSIGDQVFYRPEIAVGTRGRGIFHRGTGRFATIVPYKASATEHAISPRWEQGIWEELYFTLSYEYTLGSSQEGDYVVHSVFGAVGYRF